jgi:hypothetical protein
VKKYIVTLLLHFTIVYHNGYTATIEYRELQPFFPLTHALSKQQCQQRYKQHLRSAKDAYANLPQLRHATKLDSIAMYLLNRDYYEATFKEYGTCLTQPR